MRPCLQRPAFSLLEVLIVLAVIAVLAAIIIPSSTPDISAQLTAAGEIVVSDLAYARSLAVANDSTYQWTFDATADEYVLLHSGTDSTLDVLPPSAFGVAGDPPDRLTVRPRDFPSLAAGVKLLGVYVGAAAEPNPTSIEFGPLGSVTTGEAFDVWLWAGRGSSRRFVKVSLNPVTGLATRGPVRATGPLGTAAIPGEAAAIEAESE
jgi:prepilin-type N-terminal cleavage/methylation domain-containing protein